MDLVQKICDTDFPLRLISKRGEIIMVNSKPECINYIEGGWKTEIGLGIQDAINIFYPFKTSFKNSLFALYVLRISRS